VLVATKLLTAKFHSLNIKESESEILEKSNILPLTPDPVSSLFKAYWFAAFHCLFFCVGHNIKRISIKVTPFKTLDK